ncbi:MAG: glycosyltransferase family 4 protein [Treponema sp.]
MLKRKIAINGEFWCKNLTGIERVAREVTEALDSLVQKDEMELVVPANARDLPPLKNIKIVRLNHNVKIFPVWTHIVFQAYVIRHRAISLDFSNTCPFLTPGIEFLHDIYCRLYPADFKTRREKLIRLYSLLMYKTIARRAKRIITVSEYTKKTIIDSYGVPPERISVVYSGVGKYDAVEPDFSVFEKIKGLDGKAFYFTLGSLSLRKNLRWLAEHAAFYPDETFVVSGKPIKSIAQPEFEAFSQLKNVIFAGYLNDGEVKALMQKCRAFIFPSYFEGFGMPPLEALAAGAQVIISNAACLPEIYGSAAHYIAPANPRIDLNALLKESVTPPAPLLEKYTLKNTAARLYRAVCEVAGGRERRAAKNGV